MGTSRVRAPLSPRFGDIRSGLVGAFGALVKNAALHVCTWCRQCRARASERRALAQLTDRELRDIGLTHAEAGAEAEKWFWRP
jgi:uncharacterized protein YjiS (DUF1127 family)